jgi:hypothetical protein
MWPVEETGKNSVSPSIMAKIMASKKLIEKNKKDYSSDFAFLLGFIIEYKMKIYPSTINIGASVIRTSLKSSSPLNSSRLSAPPPIMRINPTTFNAKPI